jgi:HAMP domain-containing protein
MDARPFHKRLDVKVSVGLALLLLAVGGPFSLYLYRFHQAQGVELLQTSATDLGQSINSRLEDRMMEQKPHAIRADLVQLASHSSVNRIMLLDLAGQVKASSDNSSVGMGFTKQDETCVACHEQTRDVRNSAIVVQSGTSKVLRAMSVVENKPQCVTCHQQTGPVLGLLMIDLSMAATQERLTAGTRRMAVMIASMLIVALIATVLFINRVVLHRLHPLAIAARKIKDGDLDQVIEPEGDDEISELVETVNKMTQGLKRSLVEVDEHREYLESVINSIEDEIVIIDRDMRIVAANNTYLLHCTRRREDILKEACFLVSQDSLFSCTEPLVESCPARQVFETGRVQEIRQQYRDQQGKEISVEIHCYPIRDLAGEVRHVIEVRREIEGRNPTFTV